MSRHWPWFPPEVPINTGGLCSAGSGCHAVPRLRRSYAALRLPAPFSHRSGSPCEWPTSMRALCSMPQGADDTCARNVPCVGDGSPALRQTGMCRGEARASQVTGPSSSSVPWSNTPPETPPSSPRRHVCKGVLLPSGKPGPSASGKTLGFGAACPMAHTFACLRIAEAISDAGARLATGSGGLTLGRAGFAPAGR